MQVIYFWHFWLFLIHLPQYFDIVQMVETIKSISENETSDTMLDSCDSNVLTLKCFSSHLDHFTSIVARIIIPINIVVILILCVMMNITTSGSQRTVKLESLDIGRWSLQWHWDFYVSMFLCFYVSVFLCFCILGSTCRDIIDGWWAWPMPVTGPLIGRVVSQRVFSVTNLQIGFGETLVQLTRDRRCQ